MFDIYCRTNHRSKNSTSTFFHYTKNIFYSVHRASSQDSNFIKYEQPTEVEADRQINKYTPYK